MDYPVDIELRCSRNNQILLLVGNEVAVDRELHCSGSVCLPVHSIHTGPPQPTGFTSLWATIENTKNCQTSFITSSYINLVTVIYVAFGQLGRHCNNQTLFSYNHEPIHPQIVVTDTCVCPKRKHFLIAFAVNDNVYIIYSCSNNLIVTV